VHEELKRSRRCIDRALTDYFNYGNPMARDLCDFVYLDVFNEKETDPEKVVSTAKYITDTVQRLRVEK
jgi:hypothetical protein